MRVTLFWLLPPVALIVLDSPMRASTGDVGPFGLLAGLWLLGALWVLPVYWVARIARRAWRDGAREP